MPNSLSVFIQGNWLLPSLLAGTVFSAALAAKPDSEPIKAAPPQKVEKLTGYKLSQKDDHLGEVTVYLTDSALRIEDKRIGIVLLSKAPDWSVVAFNSRARKKKTAALSKFEGFSKIGLAVSGGHYFAGVPLTKTARQSRFDKFPTSIYVSSRDFDLESAKAFRLHPEDPGAIKCATMEVSTLNLKQTEKQAELLCKVFSLAKVKEIPLKYTCTDHDGSQTDAMSTSKIEKAAFAASLFQMPQGYKEVANMEAVRMDNEGEGALESMLEGLDDNLGKHRKH